MAPIISPDPEQKKTTACLQSSFMAVEDSTRMRIESRPQEEMLEVLKFSKGEASAGDCIWIYDEVILYSDGRYLHKYKVKGDGTIFGDRITTKIRVIDRNGYAFASWEVSHGLDPGDVREETHQGRSDEIIAHWGEIAGVSRDGTCS